nr:hypothetical protein [Tanacetum cinerariifolium]
MLKGALSSAPVLALPDPTKQFVLEKDASEGGLGTVLMQERHPVSFFSRAISPRQSALSVYEKELLAIMMAVKQWHYYLITSPFVIRTDQRSLKHLLTQKVTTPLQHKWLAKLMGYDYVIEYKKGRENVIADALSLVQGITLFTTAISQIEPLLLNRILDSQNNDVEVQQVKGKDTIFVVVDRLTKYAHFMVLGHPFSAKDVAQVFLDNIYKLHGCPNSIISDRDSIFLSSFWTEFLKLQGVSAKLSTTYHPQTGGQTEYFGPFMIVEKVGNVAYRLDLPDDAQIHPAFHVFLLKEARGPPSKIVPIPKEAQFSLQPSAVLDQKLVKRRNRAAMKVLVQCKGQTTQDATWEFLDELKLRFPDFSELTSCGQEVG